MRFAFKTVEGLSYDDQVRKMVSMFTKGPNETWQAFSVIYSDVIGLQPEKVVYSLASYYADMYLYDKYNADKYNADKSCRNRKVLGNRKVLLHVRVNMDNHMFRFTILDSDVFTKEYVDMYNKEFCRIYNETIKNKLINKVENYTGKKYDEPISAAIRVIKDFKQAEIVSWEGTFEELVDSIVTANDHLRYINGSSYEFADVAMQKLMKEFISSYPGNYYLDNAVRRGCIID